jgi:hypothetical protein
MRERSGSTPRRARASSLARLARTASSRAHHTPLRGGASRDRAQGDAGERRRSSAGTTASTFANAVATSRRTPLRCTRVPILPRRRNRYAAPDVVAIAQRLVADRCDTPGAWHCAARLASPSGMPPTGRRTRRSALTSPHRFLGDSLSIIRAMIATRFHCGLD